MARNILVETLESIDLTIKNSTKHLKAYVVEQNSQPKELLLLLGSIRFKRTCYTSKKTGKFVYLPDEVIGIEGHQRITMGAAAAILEEPLESSYRKGGEHTSLMDSMVVNGTGVGLCGGRTVKVSAAATFTVASAAPDKTPFLVADECRKWLDKDAHCLYVSQTVNRTAMVLPDNATDKSVIFTSDNTGGNG